jgi:hypothetical protein
MYVLLLHATGIGWDEAAVTFAALAALTLAGVMFLRRPSPSVEEVRTEQPETGTRKPRRQRRR